MIAADHFEKVHALDPELCGRLRSALREKGACALLEHEDIITAALTGLPVQGCRLADEIASGCLLLARCNRSQIPVYLREIISAGKAGETFCSLLTPCLAQVLSLESSRLTRRFLETVGIMHDIGTYTLKSPLTALGRILHDGDLPSAISFLEMLQTTFRQPMDYSAAQQFTHFVPRAVRRFAPEKRQFLIEALEDVVAADHRLFMPFLDGLSRGLDALPQGALKQFISEGLRCSHGNMAAARKYLSLSSRMAADRLEELKVAVSLAGALPSLTRYLRARTGKALSIRPLSLLDTAAKGPAMVCSDADTIYVPDEIDRYPHRRDNLALYKLLVRLEAGHHEFGTYDFDLEKFCRRYGGLSTVRSFYPEQMTGGQKHVSVSDLQRFFTVFKDQPMAQDMFTVFEHGRIRLLTTVHYPGLAARLFTRLMAESSQETGMPGIADPLQQLYLLIGLGADAGAAAFSGRAICKSVLDMQKMFDSRMRQDSRVESIGVLVCETFAAMQHLAAGYRAEAGRRPFLAIPFGRELQPDSHQRSLDRYNRQAESIRRKLAEKAIPAYHSDIRRELIRSGGSLREEALHDMALRYRKDGCGEDKPDIAYSIDLGSLDLADIMGRRGDDAAPVDDTDGEVFWYREWDNTVGDYLNDHVRILDRSAPEADDRFYARTVARHAGLVRKIRHAFERLRPEGLSILRQWVEGDAFDHRALIDFVMDRRMKRTPSERIYIKRIKQIRDVAALLLVDQSRSTANRVYASEMRVMDVEKEAIVLFCEALETVGDRYAVAGFSGTGRLGVDYYRIKDFRQPCSDDVKRRISGMRPMRSTRMGAAIRHAAASLDDVDNKVRILIIVGDGFPNDLNYKQAYAVEDTRRAILEARARGIATHAITVDLAGGQRLDDVYGPLHHNVISNVADLPDKLMQIYGKLTRH